jgi:hypothetical protein
MTMQTIESSWRLISYNMYWDWSKHITNLNNARIVGSIQYDHMTFHTCFFQDVCPHENMFSEVDIWWNKTNLFIVNRSYMFCIKQVYSLYQKLPFL